MNIIERAKAPTPSFFKTIRNIGLVLLGISGAVLTAPVSLPAAVLSVAGYVAVAGGILTSVSQVTVDEKALRKDGDLVE